MSDLVDAGVTSSRWVSTSSPPAYHLPVDRWSTPDEFEEHARVGEKLGLAHVEAGPLVHPATRRPRSSGGRRRSAPSRRPAELRPTVQVASASLPASTEHVHGDLGLLARRRVRSARARARQRTASSPGPDPVSFDRFKSGDLAEELSGPRTTTRRRARPRPRRPRSRTSPLRAAHFDQDVTRRRLERRRALREPDEGFVVQPGEQGIAAERRSGRVDHDATP